MKYLGPRFAESLKTKPKANFSPYDHLISRKTRPVAHWDFLSLKKNFCSYKYSVCILVFSAGKYHGLLPLMTCHLLLRDLCRLKARDT